MTARKGNQLKKGLEQNLSNHNKGVSVPLAEPLSTENKSDANGKKVSLNQELPNGSHSESFEKRINDTHHVQEGKKSKKKFKKSNKKESKSMDERVIDKALPCKDTTEIRKNDKPAAEASNISDRNASSPDESLDFNGYLLNGLHRDERFGSVEYPETPLFRFIRTASLSAARASAKWVERQKPTFLTLKTNILKVQNHVRIKIQHAQPILLKWNMHIGNIMFLLFMAWLDCTLRGIDSLMRMGTTSFFTIVWCSVLSVIAMIGVSKFLIILAVAAAVGLFLGITLGLVLAGIAGTVILWFYGSFWITGFIILFGGMAFMLGRDRVALFITSSYSVYCAWNYIGWLGLVFCLNLSFISSDILLFFLRNIINEQTRPEQAAGMQGQPSFFPNESSTQTGAGAPSDRSQGVPSTSGSESEVTSEDEVVRLLNCTDHYAALGLTRFGNIDVSVIKREYRKKAMLVHPDKNMGNEKAAEAFKKLQNAYEVLLDSFKRKEYDDELRREELLNYFRKFQNGSHENKGRGMFNSTFPHTEADVKDPMGEIRRIACKKCGFFHVWIHTDKLKSRARWCQECKDFHQAKDGDGWVEQSSQPFFFGMLQKVEAPSAYICADGKVYNATEWYICQGMKCQMNSHKPAFHVNTNVVSKNNSFNSHTKGTSSSSGQRGGGIPVPNMEETTMTEDEFFEWLQNAMQSGTFENFSGNASESPPGFNPKNSGSNSTNSSTSSKRKKKGKKQW